MGSRSHRHSSVQIAVVLAAALLVAAPFKASTLPDFGGYRPHYQGFGTDTRGGRGGTILKVTNLNDTGPGSLRAALEASGPRIVIFETSGTIALTYPISVTSPYLTIAGQTAPSPGINVRNFPIYFDTHDVVVQHIRLRTGDTHQPTPGYWVVMGAGLNTSHHVVFDHVSIAWTMYMGFFFLDYRAEGPHPTEVAVLDSLVAYGLVKGNYWGLGGGFGHNNSPAATHHYTMARTLFVHNAYRQPVLASGRVNLINNVVYGSCAYGDYEDCGALLLYKSCASVGCAENTSAKNNLEAAFINNVFIPSTGTGTGDRRGSDSQTKPFTFHWHQDNVTYQNNRIWMYGNAGPFITGPSGAGQKAGIRWNTNWGHADFSAADIWYASEPSWQTAQAWQPIPTNDVATDVFMNAGARPLDRDSVDATAVAQAQAGVIHDVAKMGSRIASQNDMGGHPTLARNVRALQVPANPNAVAPGETFRTNVEVWLEGFARALESAPQSTEMPGAPQNPRLVP